MAKHKTQYDNEHDIFLGEGLGVESRLSLLGLRIRRVSAVAWSASGVNHGKGDKRELFLGSMLIGPRGRLYSLL
jgi:hypothetical protein